MSDGERSHGAGPGLRRASAQVLTGSAAGFAIAFLLTPVLSRLVEPQVYGEFATVLAVSSVFTGVSTFRLEVASQRVDGDAQAATLVRLGLLACLFWSGALTLAALIATWVVGVSPAWMLTGMLVLTSSLSLLGGAPLSRRRRYSRLAQIKFAQGAGTGIMQVACAAMSPTVAALSVAYGAARLPWLQPLAAYWKRGAQELKATWLSWRKFALLSGGSAAVNSLAGQALILLSSALYGAAQVGFLAMAIRLLISPLTVIGRAVASAVMGEVGAAVRQKPDAAWPIVRKGLTDLVAIGALPALIAVILGPRIIPWALGSEWAQAGILISALGIGALAQFVAAPFSQLMNLTGQSGALLAWDTVRLTFIVLALYIPFALGQPLVVAVWAFSGVSVATYSLLLVLVWRGLR